MQTTQNTERVCFSQSVLAPRVHQHQGARAPFSMRTAAETHHNTPFNSVARSREGNTTTTDKSGAIDTESFPVANCSIQDLVVSQWRQSNAAVQQHYSAARDATTDTHTHTVRFWCACFTFLFLQHIDTILTLSQHTTTVSTVVFDL